MNPAARARTHCCTLHRQLIRKIRLLSLNTALQLRDQALNTLAIVQIVHLHASALRDGYTDETTADQSIILPSSEFGYASDMIALLFPVT